MTCTGCRWTLHAQRRRWPLWHSGRLRRECSHCASRARFWCRTRIAGFDCGRAGWSRSGTPSTGRKQLAATAASCMEALPDLQVSVDQVLVAGNPVFWVWTLTGTNTGPGGTGHPVRVSGIEVWTMGESGLVANSIGCCDAETYERHIAHGIER
ncbi:MAG TPA: nuclear transport factor 2 family protein [Candidatus Dormibacteraeota bacterium]|nr:nuclear transport factor 2 family protein [Candidatus Dormibacteraeota bacterium]